MRKLIYIVILAALTSVSISSCTENEVTPSNTTGGGGGTDPRG